MAGDLQKIMQERMTRERSQRKQELDALIQKIGSKPGISQDQAAAYEAEIARLKQEIERLNVEMSRYRGKNPRGAGRKPKMTEEQVKKIRRLRSEGRTIASIAEEFSCSAGLVHKLIHEQI